MQTLHESMIVTKATEYILGVCVLLLFVVYWRFVNGTPKGRKTNTDGDKSHV